MVNQRAMTVPEFAAEMQEFVTKDIPRIVRNTMNEELARSADEEKINAPLREEMFSRKIQQMIVSSAKAQM